MDEVKCPDCGGMNWAFGPEGGGSQDVLCMTCGQEFCDMGPFGLERLERRESRAGLYGLKELPKKGANNG
jgi:DNA-directed RNA polymerase subunit RPC12/RpoP